MHVVRQAGVVVQSAGRILSLLQLVFFLPLSLEHNRDTFLAFSASLAAFYMLLSTMRIVTQGSWLVYVTRAVSMTQNLVIPMLLFLCARLYSPEPSQSPLIEALRKSGTHAPPWSASLARAFPTSEVHVFLRSVLPASYTEGDDGIVYPGWLEHALVYVLGAGQYILSQVPDWWYSLLLYMSPVFSLLEGLSSLLVIQSFAHLSRWLINDSESGKRRPWQGSVIMRKLLSFGLEPSEAWQLLFLLLSATVYVLSAMALYMCFDGATDGRSIAASAIGASLASTLWISAIAFAIRKANVVETMWLTQFAYVVFNIYQLSTSLGLGADPLQMVRNFKASRIEKQVPLLLAQSTSAMFDRLVDAVEHSLYVLSAANEVLPTTVIVSLVYRLMVLYSAIRVLPRLNAHNGYDSRRDVLWRRRNQQWSEEKLAKAAQHEKELDEAAQRLKEPKEGGDAPSMPPKEDAPPEPLKESAPPATDDASPAKDDASPDQDDDALPAKDDAPPSEADPKLSTLLLNAKEPGSEDEHEVAAYVEQAKPARPVDAVRETAARAEDALRRIDTEPRGSTVLKVLVTYSRFILIAVYSHLLLLDQNHQTYWRLLTVFFTLGLWSVELLLSKEDSYLVSMYE